ncbi:MAG: DUF2922 domain-containing protein [Tissierellia bacterium]|nr:DUF2922 domain-containing protein [Tissierellia bacterium]
MNKKELVIHFVTEGEKNFTLRIPNPKDDLTEGIVRPIVEQMIADEIFRELDPIKIVESVHVLTTTTEPIM